MSENEQNQKPLESSEKTETIYPALAKAIASFPPLKMDSVNPHHKNKYASLSALLDCVKGPLQENGIMLLQPAYENQESATVKTILIHVDTGEWVLAGLNIPIGRGNNAAQAMGSAITYGRRYSLSSLLGIAAEEDTDGNQAGSPGPSRQGQGRPPQPQGEKFNSQNNKHLDRLAKALEKNQVDPKYWNEIAKSLNGQIISNDTLKQAIINGRNNHERTTATNGNGSTMDGTSSPANGPS